jgi:hypothetical protein
MMTIEDLLRPNQTLAPVTAPEMDPLREEDALQEAQLLDVRIDVLGSTAGLLLELRTSLHFTDGNAAVLVIRDPREIRWQSAPIGLPLTAFTVVTSRASMEDTGLLTFAVELTPEASLEIYGGEAELYVVEVPEIGDAPPDYSNGSFEGIRDFLPLWSSACSLLQASRRVAF